MEIQQYQQQQGLPKVLQNLPNHYEAIWKSLDTESRQVLEVKYSAKLLSQVTPMEFTATAKALLLRISVITGWALPSGEALSVLVNEFGLYMRENHGNLNADEVAYAVRNYGLDVKDWGKQMNLSLIEIPLSRYKRVRSEVSKHEEAAASKAATPPSEPKQADWTESWEHIKAMIISGKFEPIIPGGLYDWLIATNRLELTADEKRELYSDAIAKFKRDCADAALRKPLDAATKAHWNAIINNANWERDFPELKIRIVNEAKSLAVKELAKSESL